VDQSVTEKADVANVSAQHTALRAGPRSGRTSWWVRRYTFSGTVVGLVFVWLSMMPSLLSRGPLFQGMVSGISGALGYGVGVFVVWLVRYMQSRRHIAAAPRRAWTALLSAGAIGTIAMVIWFARWQDDVRDMMGVAHLRWQDYPIAAVLSIIVLYVLVEVGQLIRRLIRSMVRGLHCYVPPRVANVIAVGLVVALVVAVLNGVVARLSMRALNNTFAAANAAHSASDPTASEFRSGGPGSQVSWASLGHQGRTFVQSGPDAAQLSTFKAAPAKEPIRAYAGLGSADGIQATAEVAARELERMGGLSRKVIAVGTSTGTGWLNEAEVESLEYIYNGDTATASIQYSYLPSWLSFLVDKENARQAGEALFEAVSARVRTLPDGQRPKLVVFGESLGSFGGEAPFMSLNNLVARTDGAVFSGPTFNNTMWKKLTDNRDPGSPQWLPVYQRGQHVRFAAHPSDLSAPDPRWDRPRVVYLQHPSDPIAWWDLDLALRKPDWLKKDRGYDVLDSVQWIPMVTFLQVTADMAVATDVPDGHGHRYVKDVVNAWAAALQPSGWSAEKTERLREIVQAPE